MLPPSPPPLVLAQGNLNSWDRQPYWTYSGVDDGFNDPAGRSFLRAWDLNSQNLIIGGYSGVWTLDHDDDTNRVQDAASFLIWAGLKNYLGNTKTGGTRADLPAGPQNAGNVILYPGTDGRSQGNRRCQTDDNGQFANQFHVGNTCTSADGAFYSFSGCQLNPGNLNTTVYRTGNNTLLADEGTAFNTVCGQPCTFAQWQALGQDAGSTTGVTPSVTRLIAMGAQVLGVA
jgi:hypothetical protein